jgi:Phospholipase_D-nuclease N-terminal
MHGFDIHGMAGIVGLAVMLMTGMVFVAAFIFWLWALIDILKSEFAGSNKIAWLLVVILVPFIGMVFYWSFGREQKTGGKEENL